MLVLVVEYWLRRFLQVFSAPTYLAGNRIGTWRFRFPMTCILLWLFTNQHSSLVNPSNRAGSIVFGASSWSKSVSSSREHSPERLRFKTRIPTNTNCKYLLNNVSSKFFSKSSPRLSIVSLIYLISFVTSSVNGSSLGFWNRFLLISTVAANVTSVYQNCFTQSRKLSILFNSSVRVRN